jgi:hypothetical protein
MSDHTLRALIVVGGFAVQITGLVILAVYLSVQVRHARDIARAVGGLVIHESDEIRVLLGDR